MEKKEIEEMNNLNLKALQEYVGMSTFWSTDHFNNKSNNKSCSVWIFPTMEQKQCFSVARFATNKCFWLTTAWEDAIL